MSIRWKSSKKENTTSANDDEDEVFGVLRKRILDKVGENLNEIMKFNAFEMFGIQQKFRVDNRQLQQEMRKLQRILHPDRFVNAQETSQEKSDYLSAAVNDFYTILTNPYERGKYLLSLMSNKNPSDIESSLDGLKMDTEFLSRMMEIREIVNDPHCDSMELRKLGNQVETEMQDLIGQLDTDFEANKTDAILEKLGKLKFLVNCHRSIAERCDTFSSY